MRYVSVVLFSGLLATAWGQSRPPYWSVGGFGNVVYPGTGHAPGATPPVTGFKFVGAVGRSVLARPLPARHPLHQRTVIVPYPVFYGGYGSGYDPSAGYAPGYADDTPPVINSGEMPPIVVNQGFVPPQANPQVREYNPNDAAPDQQSRMRLYQNSSHPYADAADAAARRQPVADDQPTIYLIAFKDHSIVRALGYWMEGSTLHYVSVESSLNQASIDLIDRDLSQRLNDERGLEFKLPAMK
jgi:hypothetical protein